MYYAYLETDLFKRDNKVGKEIQLFWCRIEERICVGKEYTTCVSYVETVTHNL